jgi:hypothetical protein
VDEELTAREFHPPDAAKLKVLPAGSFYTEPANLLHFIEIREETVLQVSGIGPERPALHRQVEVQRGFLRPDGPFAGPDGPCCCTCCCCSTTRGLS